MQCPRVKFFFGEQALVQQHTKGTRGWSGKSEGGHHKVTLMKRRIWFLMFNSISKNIGVILHPQYDTLFQAHQTDNDQHIEPILQTIKAAAGLTTLIKNLLQNKLLDKESRINSHLSKRNTLTVVKSSVWDNHWHVLIRCFKWGQAGRKSRRQPPHHAQSIYSSLQQYRYRFKVHTMLNFKDHNSWTFMH